MPLKVTIVGGGLAGLAAARVLREQHEVTIVERYTGGHELGAAINLGPSAVRILKQLTFSPERAGSISATIGRTFDKTGKLTSETDMSQLCRVAGAEWYFQHRADLWTEFHRLATAPSAELGISGTPANIIWGGHAIDVDVDEGEVKLANGEVIQSDLVIAADGIKSTIRPAVVGEEAFRTARPSGTSAFRFTMPRSFVREMLNNETMTRLLDSTQLASLDVHFAVDGSNRSIVLYPCRNFELLNFVCIAPDSWIKAPTTESWSTTGTNKDLLNTFKDFTYLRPLLEKADDIKLWQLRDQDPLPTYIKGRAVLVGDAAHAMTPHQGQGGTQAIEDAEAFRLFNMSQVVRSSVPAILSQWDRIRRPRASRIQNNTRDAQAQKNPETLYKHIKYYWTYPGVQVCLDRLNAGEQMLEVS